MNIVRQNKQNQFYMRISDKEDGNKYKQISNSLLQKIDGIMSHNISPTHHDVGISANKINENADGSTQNTWVNSKTKKSVYFTALNHKKEKQTCHVSKQKRNTQKHILRSSMTPYQSLNCSFIHLKKTDSNTSDCSPISVNPQLATCKLHLQQILKKLNIFHDSRFSDKQIISWLKPYCQKQRSILLQFFFRDNSHSNKHKHTEFYLQNNREVLHHKLQNKLRDLHNNCRRFIRADEIEWYNRLLERLYIEKNNHKMEEIEESIITKMSQVRQHMRNYNNEYVLPVRKKPVQISKFLEDLKEFEQGTGSMKKISAINRNRFGTVNKTDLIMDRQATNMNQEVEHYRNKLDFKLLASPIIDIALS